MKKQKWIEPLERYASKPIQMRRTVRESYSSFLSWHPAQYEFKTASGIEESIRLNNEGWQYVGDNVFDNLALNAYRALQDLARELEEKS